MRNTVAGDDAALYNCLLLTVKDAARITGRKVIVVFSNGPDNASLVPPEDVAELAQSTGTIIYMVSTQEAQLEPISTAVFERMSKATGGKAYFAKSWRDETRAFASIRDDLAHLYSLSYYPQPNPNRGWRTITVKLVGKDLQKIPPANPRWISSPTGQSIRGGICGVRIRTDCEITSCLEVLGATHIIPRRRCPLLQVIRVVIDGFEIGAVQNVLGAGSDSNRIEQPYGLAVVVGSCVLFSAAAEPADVPSR